MKGLILGSPPLSPRGEQNWTPASLNRNNNTAQTRTNNSVASNNGTLRLGRQRQTAEPNSDNTSVQRLQSMRPARRPRQNAAGRIELPSYLGDRTGDRKSRSGIAPNARPHGLLRRTPNDSVSITEYNEAHRTQKKEIQCIKDAPLEGNAALAKLGSWKLKVFEHLQTIEDDERYVTLYWDKKIQDELASGHQRDKAAFLAYGTLLLRQLNEANLSLSRLEPEES